jgi:alpha-beta hydrolase superfamily lysophospholipase
MSTTDSLIADDNETSSIIEETFLTSSLHALWLTRFPLPSVTTPPLAQVLFIHGHGSYCTRTYNIIAQRLREIGIAAVGYDQHSYGRSIGLVGDCENDSFLGPLRASAYSKETILQDAVDVIKYISITGVPLILYGESIGGAISILLAAEKSVKIDGLILIGPFVGFDEKLAPSPIIQLIGSIVSYFTPFAPLTPLGRDLVNVSYKDPLKREWVKNDPLRYHGRMRLGTALCIRDIAQKAGRDETLSCIDIPVCVIYGTDDVVTLPTASEMVFHKTRGERKYLISYEKAYHTLFAENKDTIELLLNDLSSFFIALGLSQNDHKIKNLMSLSRFPTHIGAHILDPRPEGKVPFTSL